ncbi:hypothetical protein Aspvir_007954 [Aspergillus viridinutans]|uniref:Uncharacterized protein n=1 Tax=Aspergillus viridinutans TaxID=75553 RepID=A0A9P3C4P2_ASPVI|nr:uncharacterized protein Aspvir_007954 [Aspergillus viridinutans]GIK03879.1 hypothetical protein Aspvir_007954 [Aspergillus viridinutans]
MLTQFSDHHVLIKVEPGQSQVQPFALSQFTTPGTLPPAIPETGHSGNLSNRGYRMLHSLHNTPDCIGPQISVPEGKFAQTEPPGARPNMKMRRMHRLGQREAQKAWILFQENTISSWIECNNVLAASLHDLLKPLVMAAQERPGAGDAHKAVKLLPETQLKGTELVLAPKELGLLLLPVIRGSRRVQRRRVYGNLRLGQTATSNVHFSFTSTYEGEIQQLDDENQQAIHARTSARRQYRPNDDNTAASELAHIGYPGIGAGAEQWAKYSSTMALRLMPKDTVAQSPFSIIAITVPNREGAVAAAQREVPFALNKIQPSLVKLLDVGREIEWASRNNVDVTREITSEAHQNAILLYRRGLEYRDSCHAAEPSGRESIRRSPGSRRIRAEKSQRSHWESRVVCPRCSGKPVAPAGSVIFPANAMGIFLPITAGDLFGPALPQGLAANTALLLSIDLLRREAGDALVHMGMVPAT